MLLVGVIVFAAMQLVTPPVKNAPVTNPIKAPADVVAILQRACYDCHSNETNLSWYDKIAPASWLVNADVKEARSRFNFSTWDTLSATDQQGRVWEMVNMVLTHKMPLSTYAALHPKAKLSTADIAVLKNYAEELSPANYHDTALVNATERALDVFSNGVTNDKKQPVAANGIAYMPDFQNWQVISTTNRFDNHSIRVVYANAKAAKAVRENNVQAFPEGSTIVKAVWNSIENENGDIKPGTLNSIQVMTKDTRRFTQSKGWGFAKFNGTGLKPYGTTAAFNTTCFNCHKIADATDYLFNIPLENKTGKREVFDARGLKVITSFANTHQQTMAVLYGNEAGHTTALKGYRVHVPGEVFTLVTYQQANNKYWYGSHINGEIKSVETVRSGIADNQLTYTLEQGSVAGSATRIAEILSHQPSVFP